LTSCSTRFALRLTKGYAAAAPTLTRALELFFSLWDVGTDEASRWIWLTGGRAGAIIALELWDAESWSVPGRSPGSGRPRHGRASVHLQLALNLLASNPPLSPAS